MKNKKKLLVIASIALLGTLMTACGNDDASGNTSNFSAVTVDGDVYQFSYTDKDLPYVKVGQTINLDDYFFVEMQDGSHLSTYSIQNTNADLKVEGHNVTALKNGEYEIMLAVNNLQFYVTISCKSEASIELINFLDSFRESDGKNYTVDLGSYNRYTKRFSYQNYTIVHNKNYVAAYNKNNLGEISESTGESASFILANLSDGNGYMGSFNEEGKPEFENGKTKIGNYYICMSMLLDGSSFVSEYDPITNEETLVGDAIQAKTFLNYGMSNFVESQVTEYKCTEKEMRILDLLDTDNDGKKDTLYFDITIDGDVENEDGTTTPAFRDYSWATGRISNVGTTALDLLETAITDNSYVPVPLTPTDIGTTFNALKATSNYTTTMSLYACDEDGNEIDSSKVANSSAINAMTGTKSKIVEKNTVSSNVNVEATLTIGGELKKKKAYWVEADGKYYIGTYSAKTDTKDEVNTKEETTLDGVADAKGYMVDNVTQANINKAIWKKRKVDGNKVTYKGDIGDCTKTEQTNGLFQELFDQLGLLTISLKSEGASEYEDYLFGSFMTETGMVVYTDGSGDTSSYTVNSSYEEFTIDTSTNEVTVKALIYLPFSDIEQRYMMAEYVISNVDSTANDFSGYGSTSAAQA